MKAWAGRRVRRLVQITLAQKGTSCHLCLRPGADRIGCPVAIALMWVNR